MIDSKKYGSGKQTPVIMAIIDELNKLDKIIQGFKSIIGLFGKKDAIKDFIKNAIKDVKKDVIKDVIENVKKDVKKEM